jgi:hypothetical protein
MATAAPAIMAITAVIGAATAGYSAYQQHQAAGDAEKIAKRNAELAEQEAEEQARRIEKQQSRDLSLAKAKAAASGVDITSGSVSSYLMELEDWQKEELDWIKSTGKTSGQSYRDQGRLASQSAKSGSWQSLGQMFSYGPSIFESGQKAKWW